MKERIRCAPCTGSGKVMGVGMITKDCDQCDGSGKVYVINEDQEINYLEDRYNESYQKSLAALKAEAPTLSEAEVKEIFDNELKNIAIEKKERKKRN